jgi:general stress protein YciG
MAKETKKKQASGFNVMDPLKRKEIASMGGKKAHELKRAHRFTSEEAKAAGAKSWSTRRKKVEVASE